MENISKAWWAMMIRGLLSVLFGILVFAYPGLSLATMIIFFSVFVLVSGLFTSVGAFCNRNQDPDWSLHLIEGIIGFIIGLLILTWPGISGFMLLLLIAAWAMASGFMQLVAAIKLRGSKGTFWLWLGAIVSILFGLYIFRFPASGALAIAWLIGIYAIVFGLLFIFLGFKLKKGNNIFRG